MARENQIIFIIDDDEIMAECIAKACTPAKVQWFSNAIEAMSVIAQGITPRLIFLDVLLDGPDGFTFLNELVSYQDTAKIPIVIISSLNLNKQDFTDYGVVGVLDKSTMDPKEIKQYATQYF